MSGKNISRKRKIYIGVMKTLMGIAAVLTSSLVLFLIVYVFVKGIPNISWELLSTEPSYLSERIGILPDILNTIYIVLATLVFVLPLGVGAAIYLTEYAGNRKLVSAIEYAAETLSGIPSIIYGLVGMLFFCQFLNMQTSLMAGALTLVIMNLPTVMRTTQESLKTVPQSYMGFGTAVAQQGAEHFRRGDMVKLSVVTASSQFGQELRPGMNTTGMDIIQRLMGAQFQRGCIIPRLVERPVRYESCTGGASPVRGDPPLHDFEMNVFRSFSDTDIVGQIYEA